MSKLEESVFMLKNETKLISQQVVNGLGILNNTSSEAKICPIESVGGINTKAIDKVLNKLDKIRKTGLASAETFGGKSAADLYKIIRSHHYDNSCSDLAIHHAKELTGDLVKLMLSEELGKEVKES